MAKSSTPKPPARPPLSPEALELIAYRFKVLSETTRLKLIIALEAGERSVTQLVQTTGATQANVSRQLATLARAGIIGRRKQGVSVFYRIIDPAIFQICDQVCGSLQRDLSRQAATARLFPE